MVCPNCGGEVQNGANSCWLCGTVLSQPQTTYNPAQYQEAYFANQAASNTYKNSSNAQANIPAIISAIVMAGSTILPYGKVSVWGFSSSVSLMDGGDGWFFLVLGVFALLMAALNKNVGVVVFGVISVGLAIFEMADFADKRASEYGVFLDKGIGYYGMIVGAVGIFAAGIYKLIKK